MMVILFYFSVEVLSSINFISVYMMVVSAEWLVDGIAGFLTDSFVKRFLGNNEARHCRYKVSNGHSSISYLNFCLSVLLNLPLSESKSVLLIHLNQLKTHASCA